MAADLGVLQRLPKIVPQGVAREMAYTGERLGADRALQVGLVNAVLPDAAALLERAMALADDRRQVSAGHRRQQARPEPRPRPLDRGRARADDAAAERDLRHRRDGDGDRSVEGEGESGVRGAGELGAGLTECSCSCAAGTSGCRPGKAGCCCLTRRAVAVWVASRIVGFLTPQTPVAGRESGRRRLAGAGRPAPGDRAVRARGLRTRPATGGRWNRGTTRRACELRRCARRPSSPHAPAGTKVTAVRRRPRRRTGSSAAPSCCAMGPSKG